ncbi:MAG: hypothetical protein ING26_15830 [Roseomonas sp.]|nr:hypothetical protein [Roseomonas sp.]
MLLTRNKLNPMNPRNHPNKNILIRTKHQIIVRRDIPGLNTRRQPGASSRPRTGGSGKAQTKNGIAAGQHGVHLSMVSRPSKNE